MSETFLGTWRFPLWYFIFLFSIVMWIWIHWEFEKNSILQKEEKNIRLQNLSSGIHFTFLFYFSPKKIRSHFVWGPQGPALGKLFTIGKFFRTSGIYRKNLLPPSPSQFSIKFKSANFLSQTKNMIYTFLSEQPVSSWPPQAECPTTYNVIWENCLSRISSFIRS